MDAGSDNNSALLLATFTLGKGPKSTCAILEGKKCSVSEFTNLKQYFILKLLSKVENYILSHRSVCWAHVQMCFVAF